MSEKLTAEEYLFDNGITIERSNRKMKAVLLLQVKHYGDLRAKEAVEKFARELIEKYGKDYKSRVDERIIVSAVRSEHIKHLAKQHGVEL